MEMTKKRLLAGGVGLVAAPLLIFSATQFSGAADHLDPPARTDPAVDATPDRPADIADIYSWHTASSVIVAVTFAGPQATTVPATYDRDVLYTINISNTAGRTSPTFPIRVRFGRDMSAPGQQFGVEVSGVPGVTGTIVGPVESNLTKDGVLVRAGLFDDPFFFDLQGFRDTVSSGTLRFNNQRNFFAGQNLTGIVIEIPRNRIENGTNPIGIWTDTARFGGNL